MDASYSTHKDCKNVTLISVNNLQDASAPTEERRFLVATIGLLARTCGSEPCRLRGTRWGCVVCKCAGLACGSRHCICILGIPLAVRRLRKVQLLYCVCGLVLLSQLVTCQFCPFMSSISLVSVLLSFKLQPYPQTVWYRGYHVCSKGPDDL